LINITSIIVTATQGSTGLRIEDCKAVVKYISTQTYNTTTDLASRTNLQAITNIGQLHDIALTANMDLGNQIKAKYDLIKFFSFTYLSIRANANNSFYLLVDNEKYLVQNERALIFN
jgi:hypothetical protein